MAIPIGKMAPTVAVVVAVGYCCWPYLSDSTVTPPAEAEKSAEIPATLLTPKIGDSTGRDPFGIKAVKSPTDKTDAEIGPETVTDATTDELTSSEKNADTTAKDNHGDSATVAAKSDHPNESSTQSAEPTTEADPAKDLDGIALNATFVRGARRVAMINSQVYAEGDSLPLADVQIAPFIVSRIDRHMVVLSRDGKTVELSYPTPARAPEEDPAPIADRTPKPPKLKGDPGKRFQAPHVPTVTPTAARVQR